MLHKDQARTRLARRAVVEAARTLFADRGYGATTVEAISAHAGVPVATVYRLFASKAGILKALIDVAIAGDDAPVPIAQRPRVLSLLAETDPSAQLAGFAANAAAINARTASVYAILLGAASTEADAAAVLETLTRQRAQGQRAIARSLARAGALRRGITERDAADVIHGLMSPELYRLLVVDRRWSQTRYAKWLAGVLADQLLPQP